MRCSTCSLEGDKYVLFNCDKCGKTECRQCGLFSASEERCFPLSKRKVLLHCLECRNGNSILLDKEPVIGKLKRENEELRELVDNIESEKVNLIQSFEEQISRLNVEISEKDSYIDRLQKANTLYEDTVSEAEQKYLDDILKLNKAKTEANTEIMLWRNRYNEQEVQMKILIEENNRNRLKQEEMEKISRNMTESIRILENEKKMCELELTQLKKSKNLNPIPKQDKSDQLNVVIRDVCSPHSNLLTMEDKTNKAEGNLPSSTRRDYHELEERLYNNLFSELKKQILLELSVENRNTLVDKLISSENKSMQQNGEEITPTLKSFACALKGNSKNKVEKIKHNIEEKNNYVINSSGNRGKSRTEMLQGSSEGISGVISENETISLSSGNLNSNKQKLGKSVFVKPKTVNSLNDRDDPIYKAISIDQVKISKNHIVDKDGKMKINTIDDKTKNSDGKNSSENQNGNHDWEIISHKRYRNERPTRKNRPEPLKGINNEETSLKAAQKMSFLFLSGLAPEVTEQDVIQYLEGKNLKFSNCEKMKTKKDKHRSSFKLTVPYEKREHYLTEDLWPRGIVINHFLNLQRPTGVNYQKTSHVGIPDPAQIQQNN